MYGLLLDTSHQQAFIALSYQGTLVHSLTLSSLCSIRFISDIQDFLLQTALDLSDIHYLGVGIGPGSFLGTRIAVMTAKSFAYALHLPLVSFCSLQAYSPSLPSSSPSLILSDAKSKGAYALHITSIESVSQPPLLYSPEELKELANLYRLLSPEPSSLYRFLPPPLINQVPLNLPDLTNLVYQKYLLSQIESPHSLKIHYLRMS